MSSEGEQISETGNVNTGTSVNEENQSREAAINSKDKDEIMSHNKCPPTGSVNSICKPQDSTASVVSTSVPFWKDRKIWIQTAIVGFQLAICVYISLSWRRDTTNLISCRQGDVASESSCADCFCVATNKLSMREILDIAGVKEFKDLLDGDWKTRRKILEEDLGGKFDEHWNKRLEALRDDLSRQIQDNKEKLVSLDSNMEGVYGQLNFFFSEIGNLNNYIGVFFFAMVIGVITLIYKICINRPTKSENTRRTYIKEKEKKASSFEIIDMLSRKQIQMGTLIVSFDGATHNFHRGIFEAISANSSLSVKEAVIQNFGDLMKVEPHKLVIIFVDSNARNIILENPESEIGDFKSQATDVFISLGCDVFIVYCKDRGSENLSPDNLYNPKLKSVERHPVLSKLKERERVISVDTKFHPHQVSHLESLMQ
uniref:Uncharacterized protein LOC111126400 n=1 Tax=Crassostrea virginica TaxID=6565 RepID=A0A8B8DFI7_CRAVI|nr:uncharacterized protein LOC111126400 [Crassostrea virginica]